MEVIALKGPYHSRKEAIAESMSCVSLTPDVFIVKRPVVTTANTVSGYQYWVCRPIRNSKDLGVDSENEKIKWHYRKNQILLQMLLNQEDNLTKLHQLKYKRRELDSMSTNSRHLEFSEYVNKLMNE